MRPHAFRPARSRALRLLASLALAGLLASALACQRPGHHGRHHGQHGFSGDPGPVQVVSALIGGKNVFIPSTIVALAGEPLTLSVFNTTDVPHGFAIPALGVAEVLPAQQEHQIVVDGLEAHQVLRISCHLHTAHRSATLVVLPARKGPPADSAAD